MLTLFYRSGVISSGTVCINYILTRGDFKGDYIYHICVMQGAYDNGEMCHIKVWFQLWQTICYHVFRSEPGNSLLEPDYFLYITYFVFMILAWGIHCGSVSQINGNEMIFIYCNLKFINNNNKTLPRKK